MERNAFIMRLKPGCAAEYKKRHDAIWQELQAELKGAGVRNYSIFLDESTNTLFAYQELEDGALRGALPHKDAVKRWWAYMKDIMAVNADNSPVEQPLAEVFHLD